MAGWKTLALNRVELLEDDVRVLEQGGVDVPRQLVDELGRVKVEHRMAARPSTSERFTSFVGGDERNHAWDEIHRLETDIESLRPRTQDVVEAARAHAEERLSPERRKRFEADVEKDPCGDGGRSVALRVIREAHAVSAARHEAERQQLHGILALGLLLVVGAVATLILQWRAFPAAPLVAPPEGSASLAPWMVLGLVMMFGMLGGAFSALIALYVTNKTYTDTYWFDPRPGLALMKMSVGIWAAFFGVLGIGSGLVVGSYTGLASLVVLAFVFGYGQQVVTGLLDAKVKGLAEKK